MPIPRLNDDDGALLAGIESLRPTGPGGDGPLGRLRAIEEDTWWVHVEMHALLTGDVSGMTPEAYTDELKDWANLLADLHKKRVAAFEAVMAARYAELERQSVTKWLREAV